MRYEFIGPFVSSTMQVLDKVVQCDITKGNLSLINSRDMSGEIAVMIEVQDHARGSIIVNMDRSTAVRISNVMNGEQADSLSALAMDSIAELANMIAGNAVSTLNDLGFDFKLRAPRFLTRENIDEDKSGLEIFQVPLFTECGEVTVNALLEGH
ncbi:MAG: chemotaxis protein CheX [Nitrospirae bacterium]|nr:chemotaxis protein CheX [Nitrospirota bacterium]